MTHQTKEMYSAMAEGAVSHGLNVAVVEYTLAPEARMDRIVGEVRHAISLLHEHLGDYGADPGRIYVAGHSAGGHLTAITMPLGEVRGGIACPPRYGWSRSSEKMYSWVVPVIRVVAAGLTASAWGGPGFW